MYACMECYFSLVWKEIPDLQLELCMNVIVVDEFLVKVKPNQGWMKFIMVYVKCYSLCHNSPTLLVGGIWYNKAFELKNESI